MIDKALFTSDKQDWETPQWLFDKLDKYFNFDLDSCASNENKKCQATYTIEQDGLQQDWYGDKFKSVFCNPPYNNVAQWVKKCYEESQKGCTVVMLIPARTDTKLWHEYICKGRVTLLKGRLKFDERFGVEYLENFGIISTLPPKTIYHHEGEIFYNPLNSRCERNQLIKLIFNNIDEKVKIYEKIKKFRFMDKISSNELSKIFKNYNNNAAPFPSCIVVFVKEYDAGIRNQADDFLFKE